MRKSKRGEREEARKMRNAEHEGELSKTGDYGDGELGEWGERERWQPVPSSYKRHLTVKIGYRGRQCGRR
jgi:hypothetical protein